MKFGEKGLSTSGVLILGDIASISLVEDDPGIELRDKLQPGLFSEALPGEDVGRQRITESLEADQAQGFHRGMDFGHGGLILHKNEDVDIAVVPLVLFRDGAEQDKLFDGGQRQSC